MNGGIIKYQLSLGTYMHYKLEQNCADHLYLVVWKHHTAVAWRPHTAAAWQPHTAVAWQEHHAALVQKHQHAGEGHCATVVQMHHFWDLLAMGSHCLM